MFLSRTTIVLAIAALIPTHVYAISHVGIELEQLAQQAQVIVVGRCTNVRSSWNANETSISTYATYDVENVLKGSTLGEKLVVKSLGGTVGSITQLVVGGPRFAVGAQDVLFLVRSDEPEAQRIFGLGLGQWRVSTEPYSGRKVVFPPAESGASWGSAVEHRTEKPRRNREALARPLDVVLETLHRYLREDTPER